MTIDVNDLPASREDLERQYLDAAWAQVEARRAAAGRKAADRADDRATLLAQLDDVHAIQHHERTGPVAAKTFLHWLRTGQRELDIPGLEQKAALVLDDLGQVLVPVDITTEALNIARRGVFRRLATTRPTVRTKQQRQPAHRRQSSAGAASRPAPPPPTPTRSPRTPPQEVEVHDLLALAVIGDDELDDAPEAARAAVVDAIGAAILDAEDVAFAVGTGTGQPAGAVNATNIARIPAGQKVAVGASNTPTWAQLSTIPFLLADRYRDGAAWVMHPTSAGKVAALTEAINAGFEPGPNGRGLMGWPVRLLSALPDPATAGTTQASILFGDLRASYRIVERTRVSVTRLAQRYAVEGKVGFIVKVRVGGELLRPSAVALYTQ